MGLVFQDNSIFQEVPERRDAALNAIADWKQQTGGLVRVGAGPNFSGHMLPPVVFKFRHRDPKVEIFVETGNAAMLKEAIQNGLLDLIFDVDVPEARSPDFVSLARWESQVGIVVWRGGLPPHCSMARLASEPFILFQKNSLMQNLIADSLRQQGPTEFADPLANSTVKRPGGQRVKSPPLRGRA